MISLYFLLQTHVTKDWNTCNCTQCHVIHCRPKIFGRLLSLFAIAEFCVKLNCLNGLSRAQLQCCFFFSFMKHVCVDYTGKIQTIGARALVIIIISHNYFVFILAQNNVTYNVDFIHYIHSACLCFYTLFS